ncbi:hypothetical protein PNOK_0618700 [Pyrrhoderma noxium]|uniref:PHP domain-like protein n=1 Tax=Pyrrhoderma noxium TaxID=2282107 RepID=A0A286UDM5_9AGAM|nr:hypothetical protein PNOK_0618700 [Pyrrhoderma noxium]
MYFDLSIPVDGFLQQNHQAQTSKKNKNKQPAQALPVVYSPAQIARLEARIDLLSRLGYSVIAFEQKVYSKVDAKTHANSLDPLLRQLRKRENIVYLKRLTLILDEESEKGNGMTAANIPLFTAYDVIALQPTTQVNFQSACLTHTQPSSLTAHIITISLTVPRLPFRFRHTLVRTALKNGAVFEITYSGAVQADADDSRRNWWVSARELVRSTKGKGLIASSGGENDADLRGPKDVGNLLHLLGMAQNYAHDALTVTPKSLLIRAQTRQTYRAILSEPELILPESHTTNVVNTTTAGGTSSRVTNSAKRVADLMEGVGDSALTGTVAGENRNATQPSEGRKKKRVKTGGK